MSDPQRQGIGETLQEALLRQWEHGRLEEQRLAELARQYREVGAASGAAMAGGLQIHSLAEVNQTQPKELPKALPGTSNTPVDKVLEQRGTVYGDFRHNAQVSQELDMVLQDAYRKRSANGLPQLALHQREALRVICQKISRIATGNPDYEDNWVDIAGYAELGRKPR